MIGIPILPTEILEKIAFQACDFNVTEALKSHITKWAYHKLHPQKNLIYGDIQSGKTGEIIKVLKNDMFKNEVKVLVIQNSLLVLNQYISRLRSEGIDFQVVDANTFKINCSVILLMNNIYRYSYFLNLYKKKLVDILILDESDQTVINCPIEGIIEYHVTATPIYPKKLEMKFNHVISFDPPQNYIGLDKLKIVYENDLNNSIDQFLQTDTGIMLINKFIYIDSMKEVAKRLTEDYPEIPIVLLSSEKKLYRGGSIQKQLNNGSISKIIDSLNSYSHIIFIANRLSLRGLSYTSTDRTRHLTHQITKVRNNYRNFMQSLRICGVYKEHIQHLQLIVESDDQELLEKHKRKNDMTRFCTLPSTDSVGKGIKEEICIYH